MKTFAYAERLKQEEERAALENKYDDLFSQVVLISDNIKADTSKPKLLKLIHEMIMKFSP